MLYTIGRIYGFNLDSDKYLTISSFGIIKSKSWEIVKFSNVIKPFRINSTSESKSHIGSSEAKELQTPEHSIGSWIGGHLQEGNPLLKILVKKKYNLLFLKKLLCFPFITPSISLLCLLILRMER